MSAAKPVHPGPDFLTAALAYAAKGLPVFPLKPRDKKPITEHGKNDATIDPDIIRAWWKKYPKANIGMWCRDFVVLDIDPRNGGNESIDELFATVADAHGFDTLEQLTGGGGHHFVFLKPEFPVTVSSIAAGLDLKAAGGYIVVAPSIHESGNSYQWVDDDIHPAPMPEWLLRLIREKQGATKGPFVVPDQFKKGRQHTDLFKEGCAMRSKGYEEPELAAFLIVASKRCEEIPPEDHMRKLAASICKQYPAGPSPEYVAAAKARTSPKEAPAPKLFLSNDTGNADRLAASHGDDMLYCTDRKAFYVWNGKFWEHDEFMQVEKRAENTILRAWGSTVQNEPDSEERKAKLSFLNKSLSRKSLENMSHLAKKKVRAVKAADFDSDPFLLNVQNGVVNLRDGSFGPHRREHLNSKIIPIDYNPEAECPLFLQVIYRAMGADEDPERAAGLVEYLQRAFGCAATGKPEKLLILFFGSTGNNAKTTILEAISRTLGRSYALKLPVDSLMIDPHGASNATNSSLADLIGIRFVYTSEVNKGQQLSLAKVKDLLGLGTVKARRLRENWIEFPQQFKIFIDANDRPKISSPTDPIWNRVRCIPFDVQIPDSEIDTDMPRKLDREAAGILAWLIDGASRYMQLGLKKYPAEVGASTQAYRDASDRLKEFIADRCYENPNAWVSSAALLAAYQTWCNQTAESPLAPNEFAELLGGKGCRPHRKEIHGKDTRGWNGINLLKPKDKES